MAKVAKRTVYEDVPGDPVKSFFVEMLTRDIELEDAILDLLDNCVDGILRTKKKRPKKDPYKGFYANIAFDSQSFEISDNCGGIPWSLHSYAFRMGNADPTRYNNLPTVGYYGIGMKRAIFKIGSDALIQTQSGNDAYDVSISPEWLLDELDWKIPVNASESSMTEDGTVIIIGKLREDVGALFGRGRSTFETLLRNKVATHYAFIIAQGFRVRINGKDVTPRTTELRFETGGNGKGSLIRPFIYRTTIDNVSIFLAVGFTRPIPSQEEVQNESEHQRYSSELAGWTVVCNDRAVLYANRDEITGWGESGVPKYHTQFTAIAGIVEFRSNDPSKLPTNTTKRGIEGTSTLYLQVKNKMREGLKLFTDFTNQWKGEELAQTAKTRIQKAPAKTFSELKLAASELSMAKVKTGAKGEQYKPRLPRPLLKDRKLRRISYSRTVEEIEDVATFLFDDAERSASEVGEECFDRILQKARE